jgi:hypothetical protein
VLLAPAAPSNTSLVVLLLAHAHLLLLLLRTDPVITSVSPASGSPVLARDVTISGANFGLNANVTLNGVRVNHVVSSVALSCCSFLVPLPKARLCGFLLLPFVRSAISSRAGVARPLSRGCAGGIRLHPIVLS